MPRQNAEKHAAELHREAIVIDARQNVLRPIADRKMRLGDRVEIPQPKDWVPPEGAAEAAKPDRQPVHSHYYFPMGQIDIPRMIEGGVTAAVFGTILLARYHDTALQRALDMIYWAHKEAEDNPHFEVVTTADGIRRLKREGKVGCVLALEGLEPVGHDITNLDLFYRLGVRSIQYAHDFRNQFADPYIPHVKTGGLTELGKRATVRANELGMVIDLAHLTETGLWEVLEISKQPVVVSHGRPMHRFPQRPEDSIYYPLRDVSRGQERLDALARNGAVICMESEGGLDEIVQHIEYLIDHAGPDHVGIGLNWYGLEYCPDGFHSMGQYPMITQRLVERGIPDEVILKVLGGNMLRVFEQVLKP